jgi:hypothetical protein
VRAPAHAGFRVDEALARAAEVLSRPPAKAHIVRPVPRGNVVARFALPLALCQPQNRTRHGQAWALGKLKQDVLLCMLSQHGRRSQPLPGRPQVLCLRLSSVATDKYADFAKHAIDRLCVAHSGLGFLINDRDIDAEIHQWCEPAKPGQGCVVIEVRA